MENAPNEWHQWQFGVVSVVRREFKEVLHSVHYNDFDWEAWRSLYEEGYPPQSAVKQALSVPLGSA